MQQQRQIIVPDNANDFCYSSKRVPLVPRRSLAGASREPRGVNPVSNMCKTNETSSAGTDVFKTDEQINIQAPHSHYGSKTNETSTLRTLRIVTCDLKVSKHIKIIDSGEAVARQTKNILNEKAGFNTQNK